MRVYVVICDVMLNEDDSKICNMNNYSTLLYLSVIASLHQTSEQLNKTQNINELNVLVHLSYDPTYVVL